MMNKRDKETMAALVALRTNVLGFRQWADATLAQASGAEPPLLAFRSLITNVPTELDCLCSVLHSFLLVLAVEDDEEECMVMLPAPPLVQTADSIILAHAPVLEQPPVHSPPLFAPWFPQPTRTSTVGLSPSSSSRVGWLRTEYKPMYIASRSPIPLVSASYPILPLQGISAWSYCSTLSCQFLLDCLERVAPNLLHPSSITSCKCS